jgi:hypothetical protein
MTNADQCKAVNCTLIWWERGPRSKARCERSRKPIERMTECKLGKWKAEPREDPKAMDQRADGGCKDRVKGETP